MKTKNLLTTKRALSVLAVIVLLATVVPPAIVAAPPQDGSVVYYVQFGDTLFSISRRFGTTVPAIMTANGLTTDYIYAGQRLVIPVGGSNPPTVSPPPPTPGSFTCKYTVQPRDTIYSIAYRYRTTVFALMQANYLYSPYIFVSEQLNVPCISPSPTPFPTYTVKQADNLFRIAILYNTTIYAIAIVNGIYNPNLIYVGQNLIIPYPGTFIWPTGIPTVTPVTPGAGATTSTATATATATTGIGGNVCSGACSVVMRNLAYEPQTLTVTKGTTVTWLNIDTVSHTVTSGPVGNPNNVFRSQQLGGNQTFPFKFDNAGTYPYYCEIHGAQMTGTIVVQ